MSADELVDIVACPRLNHPPVIPGAFEPRARRPAVRPTDAVGESTKPDAVIADRAQLIYEREGGGAPRERRSPRHRGLLARLWRRLLRPTDHSSTLP